MHIPRRNSPWALLFCLLLIAVILPAQQFTTFDAVVGVPYTFDFGEGLHDIPSIPGFDFSYSFSAGGGVPPGLTLQSNGLLTGTPTAAGQYNFNINYTFHISVTGAPPFDFSGSFPWSITVSGGSGPQLSVGPAGLSFSYTAGAAASSQYVSISNRGSQPRGFSASASVISGGSWLSVSPAGGTAPPFGQGSVQVTANPTGLSAGTYTGSVAIAFSPGSEQFNIPVIMTISSAQQNLALSQIGLTFRAVSGGGAPPAQSFSVLNTGAGTLSWTATTSTLSGGAGWLSASPASGGSSSSTAPVVTVRVNPAGLAPGDYYGQVQISAPNVPNSPQAASVVLTVLTPDANPGPVVQPAGLVFVGTAGGANPAAQSVQITNLTSKPLNYSTALLFEQGNNWFTVTPKTDTVTPSKPGSIAVQPVLTGLAAGVYRGEMDVRFLEDGSTRRIVILLIVIPRPTAFPKGDASGPHFAGGCTPTKLLPVFTLLGSSFTTTAAWPTALEVIVVDDCGVPMTTGSVVATFSSGDPLITLTSLRDGRWSGTWQPRSASTAPVTITSTAQLVAPPLKGTASIGGSLQPNATTPVIAAGGAVSAVSFAPQAPVAPGSLVQISGSNLALGSTAASDLPLKTELNGTQALLAGRPLPLQLASDGQITAIVPYDVPVNATHQMIVRRGTSYSVPEPVTVAVAQPAIFSKDGSGKGAAVAAGTKPDGTAFIVDADNPVSEGDTLVISCAGLGAVDPPVDAGVAAPSSPPSLVTSVVTVTIGGQPATVVSAGLLPDTAGIYQVTITVPSGVAPAADVPVIITVADQASPPATIAVQ